MLNRGHPLNLGLRAWYYRPPWAPGGHVFPDLCSNRHGKLNSMDPGADWVPATGFPGGGYALDFDGSNDNVECGDVGLPRGQQGVSILAWINTANLNNYELVAGKSNAFDYTVGDYALWLDPDGSPDNRLAWGVGGDLDFTSLAPTVGAWAFVAATNSALGSSVWLNRSKESFAAKAAPASSTKSWFIGAWMNAGTAGNIQAKIREVRIYDRGLSDAEVMAYYDLSRQGHPGLFAKRRAAVKAAAGGGGGVFGHHYYYAQGVGHF